MTRNRKLVHITDVRTIEPGFIRNVFSRARGLEGRRDESLKGHSLCCIAGQPSTRTLMSFKSAMIQLGGSHDTLPDPEKSSEFKGESFQDTIEVLSTYHDVIVIRHGNVNFPHEATAAASVPIINAGNGPDQHPTQFLLDAYAIEQKSGPLEGHTIALCGDLANGRAPRSLLLGIAAHFPNNEVIGVPGEGLGMREDAVDFAKGRGLKYREFKKLNDIIRDATVIYMTRWQKEYRGKGLAFLDEFPSLTPELASKARSRALFMHPLPRNADRELPYAIDQFPQAIYKKEQLRAGLTVRKALLQELLLH